MTGHNICFKAVMWKIIPQLSLLPILMWSIVYGAFLWCLTSIVYGAFLWCLTDDTDIRIYQPEDDIHRVEH